MYKPVGLYSGRGSFSEETLFPGIGKHHRACLCPEGQIEPHCLPDTFSALIPLPGAHGKIDAALQSVEAQVILDALRRNKYNRLKAAHDLGIHKSTLFRKIKTLGIDLPKIDGRANRKRVK